MTPASTASADGPHPAERGDLPSPRSCGAGSPSIASLEFLAAVIGPWINHIEGNLPTLSCVLSGTDSTTAEGWLRKSNFVSHGEKDADVAVKLATARKLADMLIETNNNTMLHSQWFQGKRNPEADSLSRDTDLSDADLTKLPLSSPECQLPSNFRIAPPPNEITSWIVSQARTLPVRKQLQRPLPRSTLSRGAAGLSSCSSSGPGTTSSSTRHHPETEQSFSAPLPTPSDRPAFRGAKVFATGCVDSPRCRLMCTLVLPAQPAQGPRERRHRPAFIPSTAAVPRMQPVRNGRAAGEGDHLPAPPRDRLRQEKGKRTVQSGN